VGHISLCATINLLYAYFGGTHIALNMMSSISKLKYCVNNFVMQKHEASRDFKYTDIQYEFL
jgi:hypothetical protein